MRKTVYNTKKIKRSFGHFPQVTIFVRPWWKENNVI